jgi:hypothetical protein
VGTEKRGPVSKPKTEDTASLAEAETAPQTATPPDPAEETLFSDALAMAPELRRAFLERRCGEMNRVQSERVMALLDAYEKDGALLDQPAPAAVLRGASDHAPSPLREPAPGDRLGRYQLLERIGEGGFGIVYVAEQREPVRRRVALKLLRFGMRAAQRVMPGIRTSCPY